MYLGTSPYHFCFSLSKAKIEKKILHLCMEWLLHSLGAFKFSDLSSISRIPITVILILLAIFSSVIDQDSKLWSSFLFLVILYFSYLHLENIFELYIINQDSKSNPLLINSEYSKPTPIINIFRGDKRL